MSDFQYLRIKLGMESIVTEREMMKAANEHRAMQGFSQAYGEESFAFLIHRLNSLNEELRKTGVTR